MLCDATSGLWILLCFFFFCVVLFVLIVSVFSTLPMWMSYSFFFLFVGFDLLLSLTIPSLGWGVVYWNEWDD
ncbi:hypothetical protein EX30DRAFT_220476 [Ascodesmis nigricans]|uniref:Uncharacterized protein n=1 Tax=Ascodesmis nigricans TaxID=341454 RepID=A0A4S2N026_9PEZI|nr:hypothetical protein EX30DRAFT_220476 [Ascodesmis nigricans]